MSYPGLGKRDSSKKTKANNHEKRIARKLKARRQPNSGALASHKGDVKTPEILIDSKTTIDNRITITAEMLAKITMEARQQSRQPAIQISLKTGCTVESDWVTITLDYYSMLAEELQKLRKQVRELKHDNNGGETESGDTTGTRHS